MANFNDFNQRLIYFVLLLSVKHPIFSFVELISEPIHSDVQDIYFVVVLVFYVVLVLNQVVDVPFVFLDVFLVFGLFAVDCCF